MRQQERQRLGVESPGPFPTTAATEDTEGRVALAKELGQFLRREIVCTCRTASALSVPTITARSCLSLCF